MNSKFGLVSMSTLLVVAVLAACGGGDSGGSPDPSPPVTPSHEYISTTSRGDLVSYTITGADVAIQWNVTNDMGVINYTWNIAASCGAPDTTYGYRNCSIASASCTVGAAVVCPAATPDGTFQLMEITGTALVVHVPLTIAMLTDGSAHDELHAGFISGGCPTDVSGDYSYVLTGRANGSHSATDLFGVYRSDATFNNIIHADFSMGTVGEAAISTAVSDYTTFDPHGAVTLTGNTCQNGVFVRELAGATTRLNVTSGSGFIFDFPAGQGGVIAIKTTTAAALADLAGHNWWGISFPDNGTTELLNMTTTAVVAGAVSISGTSTSGASIPATPIVPAIDESAPGSKFGLPASYTASGNVLLASYPTPGNIPGLFLIDTPERNIVTVASKVGTQVMLYGVTFEYRNASGGSCVIFDAECIPRVSGNFIAFTH